MVDEKNSDELNEESEDGKEKKKGKGIKSLLTTPIALIAIVLVVQAGIALMMVKMIGGDEGDGKDLELRRRIAAEESAGSGEEEQKGERGKIISLENMVINLKENNQLYYLKLTVGLEIGNPDMEEEIKARKANLKDIVIEHISSRRVSDFDSREERTALKKVLHTKISNALHSGDLIKIYFSEFVIQ